LGGARGIPSTGGRGKKREEEKEEGRYIKANTTYIQINPTSTKRKISMPGCEGGKKKKKKEGGTRGTERQARETRVKQNLLGISLRKTQSTRARLTGRRKKKKKKRGGDRGGRNHIRIRVDPTLNIIEPSKGERSVGARCCQKGKGRKNEKKRGGKEEGGTILVEKDNKMTIAVVFAFKGRRGA